MTHTKIEKSDVDIYKYPTAEVGNVTELSIGDLHANAMFMMHFLVTNGVVKISEKNYERLKDIYLKSDLTKADIQEFNQIIDELEIGEKPVIRLIGDEICDRGQNDYFIFKILDKLKKSDINTEIMLSNHGIEFLIPYEENNELYAPNIGYMGQSRSMDNMRELIEKGIIKKEEVETLITESYLPNLKLISYSLHDNNITIFSHAGIGLETIQALAEKFKENGVVYKDDTAEELAQTIEAINAVFAKHVQAGKAHTLAVNIGNPYDYENDPVTFLIWNRSYYNLKRDKNHNEYKMYFAHGHDSGEQTHDNIFNLDNKDFKGATNHKGSYKVLGGQGGPVSELTINVDDIEIKPKTDKIPLDETENPEVKSKAVSSNDDIVSPFHSVLSKLASKAQILKKEGHEKAYQSAMKIHSTFSVAYNTLQKDGDRNAFNDTCTKVIAKHRPVLDKHRGWSEFLVNLAIGIPTLGIGLLVKGAVNLAQNKSFFFVHKTNSGKIVDEIEEKLNQSLSPK